MTLIRRASVHAIALVLLGVPTALLACSASAAAATCLRDSRTIAFPDGSTQIRSYVCKLDTAVVPQIRIEFHRLNEASAGALMKNMTSPDVARILGNPTLLSTSTGIEAKKLFDQFGTIQTSSSCYSFAVETPRGGSDYKGKQDCSERRYAFFNFPGRGSPAMPLPGDNAFITEKRVWPPNYKFFYRSECETLISCTILWRPATPADMDNYKQNWHRQNKLDNIDDSDPNLGSETGDIGKYLQLTKYMMRDGWHNDFLTITGTYDECGGFNFNLHPRRLILDVATIENISSAELKLDGLLVTERPGGMRTSGGLGGGLGTTTINASTTLKPGQKALAPLQMTWSAQEDLKAIVGEEDKGRRYRDLQKASPGKIFTAMYDNRIAIRKTKESFGPPLLPSLDDLVYGPSLELNGIIIDGRTVDLTERSRNFLELTVSNEEGSCPFLYVWEHSDQSWVWYGKVIHKARLKPNEATQEVRLTSFANRFRISEEELELSHIDYVALNLELANGDRRVLRPSNLSLQHVDERYVHIPAGTSLEFDFELPPDLDKESIKQSSLTIKGYYEPYSRLRIGADRMTRSATTVGFEKP
jgi:hypothetical protein